MRWWAVLFTAIVVLLAMLVGLPLLVRWVGLPLDVLLKLAATVLAWPVAATILGLVFFARFHSAIDYVIRHGTFRLPGGAEILGQAPQTEEPEKARVEDGSIVLSSDQQKQLQEFIQALEHEKQLTLTEKQNFERLYQEALQRAAFWEFRYLDAFLVPTTKNVLHWLAALTPAGGATRQQFHATWAAIVKDEAQRQIIIDVLRDTALIEDKAGILKVTQKGYSLLQFIGLVPYPPPG